MPATLLRPSALARFWALHPKTVNDWIRAGRLVAIRTPGAHYRVRPSDVRDFCARESLPVPPFARGEVTRIVIAGGTPGVERSLERALAGKSVAIEVCASALAGLVSAVREPPAIVAIDATSRELDVDAAIRALRGVRELERASVITFERAKIGALAKQIADLVE